MSIQNILVYNNVGGILTPIVIEETVQVTRQEIEKGIEMPLPYFAEFDEETNQKILQRALSNGLLTSGNALQYKNYLKMAILQILDQIISETVARFVEEHGSLIPISFSSIEDVY